jgi:tRNA G10  N-methylase Trm11
VDVTTLGWQAGCTCGIDETVPCKIYDPFIGSGTTIVAARRLGLDGYGTDLSLQYLKENARERIAHAPKF